jgi:hypothetical protein
MDANTSNQALERTADRRESSLSMISTGEPEAQLALVSGDSAFSRSTAELAASDVVGNQHK